MVVPEFVARTTVHLIEVEKAGTTYVHQTKRRPDKFQEESCIALHWIKEIVIRLPVLLGEPRTFFAFPVSSFL